MSKKSSTNKKDDEKNIDSSEEKESASIPLEDYEKIKDDYLRLAADFDNFKKRTEKDKENQFCLLYTSPSPRDLSTSRMPSSA